MKEWDQCLLMLGDAKVDDHGNVYDTKDCNFMYLDKDGEDREINVSAFIISFFYPRHFVFLKFDVIVCKFHFYHTFLLFRQYLSYKMSAE